jgi:two-component system, chemotaxis family, sensor kinase CheA
MTPLLKQFILEGRDSLQGISIKLMALEKAPGSAELMTELFRLVHTLKGNSGLFEFPEMTRVLHAGEDLMDCVRVGRVAFSQLLADRLLDAMDFVGLLLDEIELTDTTNAAHAEKSNQHALALRALIPSLESQSEAVSEIIQVAQLSQMALERIPEVVRMSAWRSAAAELYWISYSPEEGCFFKGEDPFSIMRRAPGLLWAEVRSRAPWPKLAEMDAYRCQTDYFVFSNAPRAELDLYFRYMPEQVTLQQIDPLALLIPCGHPNGGPVYGDFVKEALGLLNAGNLDGLEAAIRTLLELSSPELWLSSDLRWMLLVLEIAPHRHDVIRVLIESLNTITAPDWSRDKAVDAALVAIVAPVAIAAPAAAPVAAPAAIPAAAPAAMPASSVSAALANDDRARIDALINAQADILALPDSVKWLAGRLRGVANTLSACLLIQGESAEEVAEVLDISLAEGSAAPLRAWLGAYLEGAEPVALAQDEAATEIATETATEAASAFGRRSEDAQVGQVLKVDQVKIDLLMNLIGEMVVAKNSLPYLANRAESQYGVRELAREIKSQYSVINRIAEEMQDAIMQVRMMPVSFVFQRFPRLVRDISRKLGKEVELLLEGEETEADKNIIEALADPLIHIVRNSLDHGLELPEQREACGKPRTGKLIIRANQESDRVLIEIIDDGRGIDPVIIKRKAYEKGLIDEAMLERITDQEAVNLVFAAGFSTAETVSDLSGRGVGMDVVRNAIDKVGGTATLTSIVGRGTTLRLSLPLSMAVTNVVIIESDGQVFGVPMDMVVETVRLPREQIRLIKQHQTTVLRNRIVPLKALNDLLCLPTAPIANPDDELAVLVVRVGGEQVGLLVDDFREVVDVILKPMTGELSKLSGYAGTALLGDGSVLMILNPKELF